MTIRIYISTGVVLVLIVLSAALLVPESKSQDEKDYFQTEIQVVVKPLKAGDAIIPVDIQCEPVIVEKPDTLENYGCYFVNNSSKSIRAFGILHSIIFDTNGRPGRTSRLYVTHTYIHPDMSEEKKPFGPGDKRYIGPPGPITQPGSIIKALELAPLYVEYSDGTTGGSDASSMEMINEIREGAARYKQALRREYLRNGRSVVSIAPRLWESFSGEGQNSWTLHQRTGANAYRRFLQERYEKAGSAAVEKILSN